jgi:hypothetical protein
MSRFVSIWALTAPAVLCGALLAQDPVPAKSIEDRFREMQERYEQRISALENEVKTLRSESASEEHEHAQAREIERAIAHLPHPPAAFATPHFHFNHVHETIDVSLDILWMVGTSSEREASLRTLHGGGHDPKKRGFTLAETELYFTGKVAPCFTGDVRIVYFIDEEGETGAELEEAFVSSTCLPKGMHVEVGQFLTEFGRINTMHPHQWDFLDQPVVNSRMFGPDGMRGPGARLGWLTGLPWFCDVHVGVQNANGETMTSFFSSDEAFEERPIGGRPFVDQDVRNFGDLLYFARVVNCFDAGRCMTLRLGASSLFGPNATGPDGSTWIGGLDFVVDYRPRGRSCPWPFLDWQSEVMYRHYRADDFFDEGDPLNPFDDVAIASDTLEDWGLYSQLLWGFRRNWIAGLRYEWANGSGDDVDASTGLPAPRSDDPFRNDRHRVSTLLTFMASEHSRLRLQYNFDHAEHLDDPAHSIWFGVEFLFGKHPTHQY